MRLLGSCCCLIGFRGCVSRNGLIGSGSGLSFWRLCLSSSGIRLRQDADQVPCKPRSCYFDVRKELNTQPCYNLRSRLLEHGRRRFDFQATAASSQNDPVQGGDAVIDVEWHSLRKREGCYAADLHPGERHHFFSRGEGGFRHAHQLRYALVDVEARMGKHDTGDKSLRLLLRRNDDRVARPLGRKTVPFTECGGVRERRIDFNRLAWNPESLNRCNDHFFRSWHAVSY